MINIHIPIRACLCKRRCGGAGYSSTEYDNGMHMWTCMYKRQVHSCAHMHMQTHTWIQMSINTYT